MNKGSKLFKVLSGIFLFLIQTSYGQQDLPPNDPLYDTVFVEEFNGNGLNTNKWYTHYEWGHFTNRNTVDTCGAWKTQLDMNSINMNPLDTHNRKIQSGVLELIARKENNMGEVWTYPSDCTSPACAGYYCFDTVNPTTSCCFKPMQLPFKYSNAMIRSKKRFKYGYYEIKFKLPTISGGNQLNYSYSPNFWMWSHDSSSVWSEIDVFEINEYSDEYHSSIHVKRNALATLNHIGGFAFAGVTRNTWHTGAIKWVPDTLYYYYDNNIIKTITDSAYMLTAMNLIVDNFSPAVNFCIPLDSTNTPLPYNYKVDYVKVWQPKLACDTDKVYCNITQSNFNSKYYKSLTIGGPGCTATFNNSKHSAVGNDFVLLNEGVEIGNNMEMLICTKPCPTKTPRIFNSIDRPYNIPSSTIINSRLLRQ